MKTTIFVSLCLAATICNASSSNTTNATTTTSPQQIPVITLSPTSAGLLGQLLPPGYMQTLPSNLAFWNLTAVLLAIYSQNPRALYDIVSRDALLAMPVQLTAQLPQDVLAFHHLCQFVTTNITCTAYNGIPRCFPPWMRPTKYDNPIAHDSAALKGCGLECSYGELFFSFTPEEQKLIEVTTLVGCCITVVALFGIIINQILDTYCDNGVSRVESEKCCNRPLMWHIPFVITGASVVILFFFFLPFMVGRENIVCKKSHGYTTLSFGNPGVGQNSGCAAVGSMFYASLMVYFFYTLLLSFVIFRQFWNPTNPLWQLPNYVWHGGVFTLVLVLVIIAVSTDSFDPIYPMGICFPGVSRQTALLLLICIPFLIITILAMGFLSYSVYRIQSNISYKEKHTSANVAEATRNMRDLRTRLVLYCVGEVFVLILLTTTAFVFYGVNDALHGSFVTQFQCVIFKRTFDQCPRETSLSPFWFMTWTGAILVAAISQLVLSCHDRWRARVRSLTMQVQRTVSTLDVSVIKGSKSHSPRSPGSPGSPRSKSVSKEPTNTNTVGFDFDNATSTTTGSVELR